MPSLTLDYETPHFLQSLIAHDESLLKSLAAALGLKVTSRDAWVKLEGDEEDLVTGQKVFAQLEKARIAVTQQQANMRDAEVRVPIAGQILRINTRVGEQVNTQQGIVELAKTNQMYAIAEIPESSIGKIRTHQERMGKKNISKNSIWCRNG